MTSSRDPAKSRPLSANVKRLMQLSRASPQNEKVMKASRFYSARDLAYCHNQGTIFMEAAAMGISMDEFAPLYMNSQMAGVFDVSFSVAGGMENDELSNLLRIPLLLKSPDSIVEALYWIDGIVSNADEGQNKSLLLSQAYEAEKLKLPDKLKGLPGKENKNIDDLSYAYFLGYIYRYECLLHEESSRMVYGAFDEGVMRKAYDKYISSPLSEGDLAACAIDICRDLDRMLVEEIWPAEEEKKRVRQAKEMSRGKRTNGEGKITKRTKFGSDTPSKILPCIDQDKDDEKSCPDVYKKTYSSDLGKTKQI